MKWYFAASGPGAADLLADENVEHILLSHALNKSISKSVEARVKKKKTQLMIDSGGFSYALAKKECKIEPYLEFLGTHKHLIAECVVLDDFHKREVTFANMAKMRKAGVDNVLLVDHMWFKYSPSLHKFYNDEDKLCWGGLAVGGPPGDVKKTMYRGKDDGRSNTDWRGVVFKRVQERYKHAVEDPFTKVHLLGVGQRLKRFLPFFDAIDSFDSAVWSIVASKFGRWVKFYDVGKDAKGDNLMPNIRFYYGPHLTPGKRPPKEVYEQAEDYKVDLTKHEGRERMSIREFKKYFKRLEELYKAEKSKGFEHLLEISIHKSQDDEEDWVPMYRVYPVGKATGLEAEARATQAADKLTVGKFFYQPKPTRPAFPEQLQTVKGLLSLFEGNEEWFPTVAQKKYDGANHQIHKDGDKVWIFSEDGDENTDRLPGLIAAVKKLRAKKLVMPAEIEAWDGKQHLPREAAAGYLNGTDAPDDDFLVANVYDLLLKDDVDLHSKGTSARLEALGALQLPQSTEGYPNLAFRLNKAPSVLVEDLEQLEKTTERLRRLPGSEGAVFKQSGAPYPLAQVTPDTWVKFHNATIIYGVVYGREKTAGGVWVYQYAVLPGKEKALEQFEAEGQQLVPVGDTFATRLDLKNGDTVQIEAETVNLERTPEGLSISAWVPRVISEATQKPDTVDKVVARARGNLVLQEKDIDKEGNVTYRPTNQGQRAKQEDPYLEAPDEDGKYRFVVQHHWRGKTVHSDLRIEIKKGGLLLGWTLNTQIPGVVQKPVLTLEQAKQWSTKGGLDRVSKINWITGDWATRPKAGTDKLVRTEIMTERKAPEPHAWIDVEGKTKDPVEGEPPPVGGTRQFPGVFDIVDEGTVEYGAQKPWFHEYFFHGKGLNYRFIVRQLKIAKSISETCEACGGKADFSMALGEPTSAVDFCHSCGSEVSKAGVVLPSSEDQPVADNISWLAIRPDDLQPYVLDKEAVDKQWMPPEGHSALPASTRAKVPVEYRYWTKRGDAARTMRDALAAAISEGKVTLDYDVYKAAARSLLKAEFVLQEQTWRGPIQVRLGPSRTRWWVRLDVGRPSLVTLELDTNPVDNDKVIARVGNDSHKASMDLSGKLSPGHYLNPTKDTPSFMEKLDGGSAEVMVMNEDLIKVRFAGEQLKGLYLVTRNNEEWLWSKEKDEAPKAKAEVTKSSEFDLYFPFDLVEIKKSMKGEKRLVTGVVLEPEVVDAQKDWEPSEVIEKAAHAFLANYNRPSTDGGTILGINHKVFDDIGVELVESSIAHDDYHLGGSSKAKKVKKGSWVMTVHVSSDKTWNDVKTGKLTGFSVAGTVITAANGR